MAGWKNWRIREWNDFLVQAYFYPSDGGGDSIQQFDASFSFLSRTLNISAEEGHEAQRLFVSQFQVSRDQLRKLFNSGRATDGWTEHAANLPFFAQLYLSLIVASATEETKEEGNFRERLCKLLDRDIPQNYVNCLPALWEAARDWSIVRASSDLRCRVLVLPDPRHETIIGYSKRLSFPGYRDQIALADVLCSAGLNSESPINQLVHAVAKDRARFSADFRDEFDLFVSGRDQDPKNARVSETPFWRAVESITWETTKAAHGGGEHAIRLELSLAGDEEVSIQVTANKSYTQELDRKWATTSNDDYDGHYEFCLEKDATHAEGQEATAALLEDQNQELLRPIRKRPLARQIGQGCVIFVREDAFTWVNSAALPPNGEVCLLFRSGIARKVVQELERYDGPHPTRRGIADVAGWSCIGPMAAAKATILSGLLQFKDLNALELTMPTSHIRLVGGLRLPEGLLFLRPLLPEVYAPGSDTVDCVTREGSIGHLTQKSPEEPGVYLFDPSQLHEISLPTKVHLSAYAEDKPIRAKAVDLVGRCAVNKYKTPSDLHHWLEEGAEGQLVGCGNARSNSPNAGLLSAKDISRISQTIARRSNTSDMFATTDEHTRWIPLDSLPQDWADLLECLAALMTKKSGVGWAQLCELISVGLGVSNRRSASAFLESLIQNGFVRRVFNRRWRGVRLLGVQPEQHVDNGPGMNEKRIVGLLSSYQRDAVLRFAAERGGKAEIAQLTGANIYGVTRVVGDNLDGLEQAIDINDSKSEDMWSAITTLPSPEDVLVQSSSRSAARASNSDSRWWDTSKCGFYFDSRPESDRYALCFQPFANQLSSYSLFDSGKLIWQTEDRSWAVFLVGRLASESRDLCLQEDILMSKVPLPLGLSHFAIQNGAGVIGFVEDEDTNVWSYPLDDAQAIKGWLLDWGLASGSAGLSPAMNRWATGFCRSDSDNRAKASYVFSKRYS